MTAVIGRALETARSVLRDLDVDQVPASLRRVVAHAGELTPPLADKLAREIDRLEWLRTKAVEAWPAADPRSDGPDRGSALFLLRPDGWVVEFAKVVADSAAAARVTDEKRSGRVVVARDREVEVAREKAKTAAKEAAALGRRIAEMKRLERAPDRERAAAEARVSEEMEAVRADHAGEVADLERRVEESAAALRGARAEARQARRERADAEHRLAAIRDTGSWADRDPVDLAVHLDAVAAQARAGRRPDHPDTDTSLAAPALPAGIRPDSAAALDAVLRMTGPLAVLVDGYNAGLTFGSGTPAEVRNRLEDVVRRVRTLAGAGTTVTVVWDSSADHDRRRSPDGLDVRFAPPGVPADDVLVELAAEASRAVVVTNDREVRERAEAVGALALWSTALVEWARTRH